jgi:hypothetical protein
MGRMLRPKATVLPESAMVPDRNLIQPPPNQFSHEIVTDQPYYYVDPQPTTRADEKFEAGTKVLLIAHDGGTMCHVADGRGLYVVTAFEGLRPIH